MAKIYTKTGDKGQTGLVGGTRVSKTHPRIQVYGTVDELNSFVGLARSVVLKSPALHKQLDPVLFVIQQSLFDLGSQLACEKPELAAQLPQIANQDVEVLEGFIDQLEKDLPELKSFVLPGGTEAAALLHVARTVTRRAEREAITAQETEHFEELIVRYLNRLSDLFFVMARTANHQLGVGEVLWKTKKP